jgi:predicted anti-sigma-YlaC factor YlaD
MNCKSCRNELDEYLGGRLTEKTRKEVEQHLGECSTCSLLLSRLRLADQVIESERNTESNPFLSTRVMAAIDSIENSRMVKPLPSFAGKFLKPALITISVTAAVFLGILAGNIGRNYLAASQIPEEIVYLNDSDMESVSLYITE